MRTGDFKTWGDITGQITIPPGARHGTAISAPDEILKGVDAANPG
jgi:hypothetical protein